MKGKRAANCGTYVWTYLAVDTLRVGEVALGREVMAVDVREDVRVHLGAKRLGSIVVDKIEWEPCVNSGSSTTNSTTNITTNITTNSNSTATKLAVQVSSHGIVAVYQLYSNAPPVIIQQDASEGIELFFWIPNVPETSLEVSQTSPEAPETSSEGSYYNCKQLLVYTRNHLHVKLYSLDFVNMLWKLSKPISQTPILNPQNINLWSLVLASRSPDVSDETPVVYHFYNQGSMSNLLYRFKLKSAVLAQDFDMFWTKSGKWLVYFNWIDLLYGFKLQVYNSLGVNQNRFNSELIPTGDPIIDINWMTTTDGIETSHEFPSLNYWICDLWVDELREYLFIVLILNEDLVQIVTVSIKDFRVISKEVVDLEQMENMRIWSQYFDGELLQYVGGKSRLIMANSLVIKKVFTQKFAGKFKLIIQFESSIMICDILFNDENSTKLILFKPLDYILTERVEDIEFENQENNVMMVTTATHMWKYDMFPIVSSSTPLVIYQGTNQCQKIPTGRLLEFNNDQQWSIVEPISNKRLLNTSFVAENDTFFKRKRSVH